MIKKILISIGYPSLLFVALTFALGICFVHASNPKQFQKIVPIARAEKPKGWIKISEKGMAGKSCQIEIQFGSSCCGINKDVFDQVKNELNKIDGLVDFSVSSWGKEGEKSICILSDKDKKQKVYLDVKKLLSNYLNK